MKKLNNRDIKNTDTLLKMWKKYGNIFRFHGYYMKMNIYPSKRYKNVITSTYTYVPWSCVHIILMKSTDVMSDLQYYIM